MTASQTVVLARLVPALVALIALAACAATTRQLPDHGLKVVGADNAPAARAAAPLIRRSGTLANEESRIQFQLDRKLPEVKVDVMAFSDVLDSIRDAAGMKIDVRWKVIEDAGITRKEPVTARLFNVKASKAIQVIIDCVSTSRVRLHSEIDFANNQLIITTYDDYVARNTEDREYDIRDLIKDVNGPKMEAKLIDDISKLIMETVASDSWVATGGKPGVIKAEDGRLIITQTRENHRQIGNLMAQLCEAHPNANQQQQSDRSTQPADTILLPRPGTR